MPPESTPPDRFPSPTATGDATDLWARYRDNLPRHLMAISREVQARVMQFLSERRRDAELRLSFGPFLALIWEEGQTLRDLAEALSISKQACSQLANAIEAGGYLERTTHPRDRRAKIVRLTRRGRALVAQGAELLADSDAEYAAIVGSARYREFTHALVDLYEGVRTTSRLLPSAGPEQRLSIGVLPLVVEWIQRRLMESASARGHAGLKMSHGQVLPWVGLGGGRIHEIARIQRVSRQAISAISQDLEAHGYVHREPDLVDRRGVVLTLTKKGESLIEDSVAAVDELELEMRDQIGSKALAHLKQVAAELYDALNLEGGVFASARRSGSDLAGSRAPIASRPTPEIERLAAKLRRELGRGDASQLAGLLEQPTRRNTP